MRRLGLRVFSVGDISGGKDDVRDHFFRLEVPSVPKTGVILDCSVLCYVTLEDAQLTYHMRKPVPVFPGEMTPPNHPRGEAVHWTMRPS